MSRPIPGRLLDALHASSSAIELMLPGIRLVTYGHVGDGNLHHNLSKPVGGNDSEFLAHAEKLTRTLYDHVAAAGGSISAEHGLGTAKRDAVAVYKSPVELDIMRDIKAALDPHGLMNPGKVLQVQGRDGPRDERWDLPRRRHPTSPHGSDTWEAPRRTRQSAVAASPRRGGDTAG